MWPISIFGDNDMRMKQIVHETDPVVLVGGGDATPQVLHKALRLGRTCVAADGGAVLALAAGITPDCVIGDFDSLPPAALAQLPKDRLHQIVEQDDTDFEKAMARITAPVVIGVGFTGGRIDHQLAACHSLMRFAQQSCVLWGATEAVFLAPPRVDLPTRAGDVVSLFPMGAVTGRSAGLKWPIDGIAFAPGVMVGTSNEATGPCRIEVDAPAMLVMVPLAIIPQVVDALGQTDSARWPARG